MPDTRRPRILFVAEAVTLAHVGRMLALAETLDRSRYEPLVACDPRYRMAIGTPSVPLHDIHTIPSEQFFNALDGGKPIYRKQDLITYVEEDLKLIEAFRPDVVVGDFRLSLAASARLARVPYISLTNAYWSPFADIRYVVPDIPPTRILGVRLAQKVFDLVRPLAFAQHAAPINGMLRHFNQPRLPADLRHAYTNADFTLYSDIAELVPTRQLPSHHQFIGPVQWAPNVATPAWWDRIPTDKPVVYVNLGSSGHGKLLPEVMSALSNLPLTVVGATAGRVKLERLAGNEFVADFLPGDQAVERATLVICNGGSPTCYQALAAGKPVIGMPVNLDQYLNMSLVENAGAGISLRSGKHSIANLVDATTRIIETGQQSQQAHRLSGLIRQYDPAQAFGSLLTRLTGT